MDRKQPLILILLISMFGIAIAAAIYVFGERNIRARRETMLNDITRIAADAYQYRLRPATLGGGGGDYEGYTIPAGLRSLPMARYEVATAGAGDTLLITVTAARTLGRIHALAGPGGKPEILQITGDLAE